MEVELYRKKRCRSQNVFKTVLRVITKECAFYVRIFLICFNVIEGIVIFCSKEATDFIKVNHDQKRFFLTCDKWMSEMNFDEQYRDNASNYQDDESILTRVTICCIPHCSDNNLRNIKGMFFVNRLSIILSTIDNLELNEYAIDQNIENIMTTSQELLADFNFQKMISFSKQTKERLFV